MPTACFTARRNMPPTICRCSIRRRRKSLTSRRRKAPTCPKALGPGHAAMEKPVAPSAYWGMEKVWDTKFDNHNDMIDSQGRVWMTGTNHAPGTPTFCRKGSDILMRRRFQSRRTSGSWRCSIRRRKSSRSSIRVSARIICNSLRQGQRIVDLRRVRWQAGSIPKCSTRPAAPKKRRAGRRSCSISTVTASSTTTPSRASRRIRTRTCGSAARALTP